MAMDKLSFLKPLHGGTCLKLKPWEKSLTLPVNWRPCLKNSRFEGTVIKSLHYINQTTCSFPKLNFYTLLRFLIVSCAALRSSNAHELCVNGAGELHVYLIHVETFGFRGEALSSLCALSQVGTKLVFDHQGHLVQRSPCPRQPGTTVTLQQLFYTLPVRHKEFQRNIKKAYCIISTGVRITCSNQNGQGKRSTVLSTSGSHTMRENIGAIFGPKQVSKLTNEVYHMYNRHQYPFVALNIAVASASASKDVLFSGDNKAEPVENNQPATPSLKSAMNLAALKAAFSNKNSAPSGSKSSMEKASNSGPSQKTLQCFFKDSVKSASTQCMKSPVQLKTEAAKRSSGGGSVLDGFRYGGMSISDQESEKDSSVASCDFAVESPDSSEPVVESVNNDSPVSQNHPEDTELQTKACSSTEDSIISPEAKRARIDNPGFTAEQRSDATSKHLDTPSSMLDVPVCLQRKTLPLHFSLQDLAASMKRLLDQQRQRAGEKLHYRRFRAKINPGENQSAEDELRREIR
ncbi:hypothetical protein GOODEAATRI_017782 [Goodea atripinnis]|uniref:Uncharacterized protein n=2 Tax=Goodeidae TaxID=28758 RepID=A0ABV0N2C3_9TELE